MEHREVYLNFIHGQWKQGSSGAWDDNRNPARPADLVGKFTRSTVVDAARAVEAAHNVQPEWSHMPRPRRAAVIEKVAVILRHKSDQFAKVITREQGKNLAEARGEVLKTIHLLEFMAAEGRRPVGEMIPSEMPNTQIYTTRSPLGVVAVITPWNFPLSVPAAKIAPALLEGNTVVFKPSSLTPGTASMLVRTFEEAGLPAGVLNLVYGSGTAVGVALVSDSRVRAVSFTGSNSTGQEVAMLATKRGARVQTEMGGKNPMIVLADADLDQAVEATIIGAFGSAGQRCTATSYVLVDQTVHREFMQKLVTRARSIRVGEGLMDPAAMGPLISEPALLSCMQAVEEAKLEGAIVACGGERVSLPGATASEAGHFLAPTVLDFVRPEMKLMQEEVFGPVLGVIPISSLEEAVKIANSNRFGLAASVFTRDYAAAMRFSEQIESGLVHVNSPTVGGEVQAPFGGIKQSGSQNRAMGSAGCTFYYQLKTVYLDYNQTVRQGNLY